MLYRWSIKKRLSKRFLSYFFFTILLLGVFLLIIMTRFELSDLDTHLEEIQLLDKLGFETPDIAVVEGEDAAWQETEKVRKNRDSYKYQIDGAVIKLNDNKLANQLGYVGKAPRGWAAIKFPGTQVTSKLTGVTWQVGRTGRLTPVAEIEPVEIDGTVVRRATLHNYKEFCDKELCYGDMLIISKAGDIIPEVVDVLRDMRDDTFEKIKQLTNCPSCQSVLELSGTEIDQICANIDCRDQIVGRLKYYSQRNMADIRGLSAKNIELLVDELGISDICDLYDLDYSKVFEIERFGRKSVDNLKESIEESKKISAEKLLAGLGIDGVGIEVAKLILEKIKDKELAEKEENALI